MKFPTLTVLRCHLENPRYLTLCTVPYCTVPNMHALLTHLEFLALLCLLLVVAACRILLDSATAVGLLPHFMLCSPRWCCWRRRTTPPLLGGRSKASSLEVGRDSETRRRQEKKSQWTSFIFRHFSRSFRVLSSHTSFGTDARLGTEV